MPKIPVTPEAVVFISPINFLKLRISIFPRKCYLCDKNFHPFTLYMHNMYALESFSFSYWTLCLLQVIVGPEKMIVVPPRHYCVVENPAIKDKDSKPVFDTHGQVCGWVESVSVCVCGVGLSVCVCVGGGREGGVGVCEV